MDKYKYSKRKHSKSNGLKYELTLYPIVVVEVLLFHFENMHYLFFVNI